MSRMITTTSAWTVTVLVFTLISNIQVEAEPEAVWFMSNSLSGGTVAAEKIGDPFIYSQGDNFRDLVTNSANANEFNLAVWLNLHSNEPPYFSSHAIDMGGKGQLRFGKLLPTPYCDLASILSQCYGPHTSYIRYNDNTGFSAFSSASNGFSLPVQNFSHSEWGNVNNDAYGDLVAVPSLALNYVKIFCGNSGGTFNSPIFFDAIWPIDQMTIADLDDQNNPIQPRYSELIMTSSNMVKIYEHQDPATFNPIPRQDPFSYDPNGLTKVMDLAVGDLNKDGYNDLVICTADVIGGASPNGYIKAFLNDGYGCLNTQPQQIIDYHIQGVDYPQGQIALGDFCNNDPTLTIDGFPDLAMDLQANVFVFANLADNTGLFDEAPIWSGNLCLQYSADLTCHELICTDLGSVGAQSIVCTGQDGLNYYDGQKLFVFKDNSDPPPAPVENLSVTADLNNYALIQWQKNNEDDISQYRIYRDVTEGEFMPVYDDFELLATINHPEYSYVDDDVIVHTPVINRKIWYYVTALDAQQHESLPSNIIRFWALFHPQSLGPSAILTGIMQPGTFCVAASPNPFNVVTSISYSLPEATQTYLKVYDVSGRLIETLANGWKEAGTYSATFKGSDLPTGMYLYVLNAGKFRANGKLLLLK